MKDEKLIKEIASKVVKRVLSEAELSTHFMDRLEDRIKRRVVFDVGFEIDGSMGKYTKLGTYEIPEDIKNSIIKKAYDIENREFSPYESFGILLHQFLFDLNSITFPSDAAKRMAERKIQRGKKMVIIDENSLSNGNMLFTIIRGGVAKTLMLVKSYTRNFESKLRVDKIVKL